MLHADVNSFFANLSENFHPHFLKNKVNEEALKRGTRYFRKPDASEMKG